jgi:hypothetical protein
MMRLTDAALLAVVKFKTRRIRLGIAVVISGLLFVAFSAASFIARGSIASIDAFSREGFAGRYMSQVQTVVDKQYTIGSDKDVIAAAKELDKKLLADKKAEAKRLGIEYDPKSEALAVQSGKDPNGAVQGQESVNTSALQVQPLIHQKLVEASKEYLDTIAENKSKYPVTGIYKSVSLTHDFGPNDGLPAYPYINIIKKGVEVSADQKSYTTQGIDGFKNGWTMMDDQLMTPFLLPNQSLTIDSTGAVPLVAPFGAVEEMLGINKLADSASSQEKLAHLKDVRAKAAGTTFAVCARNQTSGDRQQQAASQQQELINNKNTKDYQKPELIYDKSPTLCSDVVVARDVRDYDTKQLAIKQEQFDQKFGKVAAAQRVITFRVVGVVADLPSGSSFSVEEIIGSLLSSNLGKGWFTPRSALPTLPDYKEYVEAQDQVLSYSSNRYVELPDAATTKQFVKDQTCTATFDFGPNGPLLPKVCQQKKQFFTVTSFGSNSVAMDSVRSGFSKYFVRALLFASVFSALILMGTVGRVMSDSRRETAVFRAIGAKRLDIAQIYITYVLLIGASISIFAIAAGYTVANLFDARYHSALTIKALLAYNANDLGRQFHMRSFDRGDIGWLVLIIMAGSLLSALLPLLTNLKRNPISDMRDER